MAPQTRRLVQLTIDAKDNPDQLLDMLLAKKRAGDRREWLESKGNLAQRLRRAAGEQHERPGTEFRGRREASRSRSSPSAPISTTRCT